MLTVLDALAAWRETIGLSCAHALSSNAVTEALPSSRLAIRAKTPFTVAVCVPLEVTETVTVEATEDEPMTALLASLRALSGKARVQNRIHSHTLVSEVPGTDANKRRQVVLTWDVVASWS